MCSIGTVKYIERGHSRSNNDKSQAQHTTKDGAIYARQPMQSTAPGLFPLIATRKKRYPQSHRSTLRNSTRLPQDGRTTFAMHTPTNKQQWQLYFHSRPGQDVILATQSLAQSIIPESFARSCNPFSRTPTKDGSGCTTALRHVPWQETCTNPPTAGGYTMFKRYLRFVQVKQPPGSCGLQKLERLILYTAGS